MRKEELETTLTALVRRVNGTHPATTEPQRFELDALLFEDLDIDSLATVELAEEIESHFAVAVSEDELKNLKSFGALTCYVESILG
jgi:acyl carrier protein